MDRSLEIYDSNGEISSRVLRDVTWSAVRQSRDDALEKSDWRAVKDRVLSTAWKEYRQALRDLPQDHAEANDAADAWPVVPDA
jgi:hypothetical protein